MSSPDTTPALSAELLEKFTEIVGDTHALTSGADQEPYLVEWRRLYKGKTQLVLRPGTVGEVARILALANETGIAIVPQGGNTGLVGGQIPFGGEILLSLQRLKKIRSLDTQGNSMIVEAGVTLAEAQTAAEDAGRLFPLSIAAEGTAQIGGVLSTNAGGVQVLAYGNARAMCLGLEVVTADGQIWNGLRQLRKDNTGYNLRDLFIGAEGTLGVITAAVLKLWPQPQSKATAFVGMTSVEEAAQFFDIAREMAAGELTAFELMPRIGIDFVIRHADGARDPLESVYPWYALVELSSLRPDEAQPNLEKILMSALEKEIIADAAISSSLSQSENFWRLRENLSEVQLHEGGSIKNDVSVPIAALPRFLNRAVEAVTRLVPGCRPVPFGHYGDGNIHFNVSQPIGMERAEFMAHWNTVVSAVNEIVLDLDGSISAEHGIGYMKRELLTQVKAPVEIAMMRQIKQALDPKGVLNPGKVL
ncbi:MAG: FAD-binding oxidoreductase [Hyphomicrobiales bacterium]|nr:FAD-binding oxidoreductase [Hyphomicrobiales bacterium]